MKIKKVNIKNKLLSFSFFCILNFYEITLSLDTTFGENNNGTVITSIDSNNAQINNLNLQTNNSLVGIGYFGSSNSQFALAQYTTGGILDTSFGNNGIVITNIDSTAQANGGAINTTNGTIIAAGSAYDNVTTKFALARYSSTGDLDATFGTAGIVKTLVGDGSAINAIALDSSNNIIAGGSGSISGTGMFTLARYLASNGGLDTSGFNPSGSQPGVVTTQIQTNATVLAIAIQPSDGKIVAGGFTKSGLTNDQFALARYNTDGSLDTIGFNSGGSQPGTIITPIGNLDKITGIAIDGSGNIVVSGFTTLNGLQQFAVARYTPAGVLDTTFATSGIFTTTTSNFANGAAGSSILIQSNGQIVVGGYTNDTVGLFAVIRLNNNGTFDTTFGTNGIATASIQDFGQANSIVIQPDGKIVAGGLSFSATTSQISFALARFVPNNFNFITITSIANGSTIVTNTPTVAGSSSTANTEVDILVDNSLLVTGTTSSTGAWNLGTTNILSNGIHMVQSNLLLSGIKIADYAVDFNVNSVDSITITTPAINSTIGGTTTLISGTSNLVNQQVVVLLDGPLFAVVNTDAFGNWNAGTTSTLSAGKHFVLLFTLNSVGNIIASAANVFTVS